ncbi:putative ABC transporter permease protein YtlD [Paenibacillus sp. J45TS6]|uniref:ABC transporter permease n=1 Tax=Paenibacillus sp. J45TS6 TaxID=2807196 RepID=UPI001B1D2A00|nr:ABC transporter permease [Paenibacillus sp. J45TS6]GIP41564.1 putative ABC transporter permease protein YtlD [Paenibacillus sp. J45TS6]
MKEQEGLNPSQGQDWLGQIHGQYNRKRKSLRRKVSLTQIGILIIMFLTWEVAGRMKWIDVLLFSYPSKIFGQLGKDVASGEIWSHLSVTVFETVVGFLLGTILGTLIAILIWWSPFLSKVLDPYLVVFNSMPKVALGPIFIVMFGAGFTAIIMTTISITVIITTLVVYNSFNEVDPNYVKVVRTFGANRKQIFRKVIFPASFPAIVSTLKVNVGLAWIGVIVGEFLVAKEGLGYLIIYGFQVFNFTLVMSSLIVIAVVATMMYQLVAWLERKLMGGREL